VGPLVAARAAIDAAARFSEDADSRGRYALHRDLRHDLFLPVLPQSLTVSIVTHRPDFALLERCLRKLALAIGAAREDGVVKSVALALIDNSEDRRIADEVTRLGKKRFADSGVQLHFLHGHPNIGYGIAHNLMLHGTGADYQLVLNPDVEVANDALLNAIRWLDVHPETGAAAPAVTRPDGTPDYLCKRYPAVFDLLLRGFAPTPVRRWFRRRLDRYDLRDVVGPSSREPVLDVPVMSGCCMLVRRSAIDVTGGFDPKFFLYFEDFDWSVRLSKVTRTAYLPSFRVVHHGGGAARKGWKHILWFTRSALRFYNKHGWRFF
jgi:GT2 family glycosyltransferase